VIIFKTQEEFEAAVIDVLISFVTVDVEVFGDPFVRRVKVGLRCIDDGTAFVSSQDSVY
jgi:hypothetical protein